MKKLSLKKDDGIRASILAYFFFSIGTEVFGGLIYVILVMFPLELAYRSEERRVGKECR